jgi:hypothetical protein
MRIAKIRFWFMLTGILFTCLSLNSYAQVSTKTVIKGTITDAKTGQPIPFASAFFKKTTVGTVSDTYGWYLIETTIKADTISFSFLGYTTEKRAVVHGKTQIINIKLNPTAYEIGEVIVKPTKRSYSNRNNPAVDLIDRVIAKKSENKREGFDYLKYEKYEKILFALSNINEEFKDQNLLRKYRFIFENVDTTKQKGKEVLPVFLKESLSNCYFRKDPKSNKEIISAEKTINFDEYIDNKGVTANINYLYQDIDIYKNNITFLTNNFLSPIAQTAPIFYRYYIVDTALVEGVSCIRLFFEPRNKAEFLFQGVLFITQDSSYAVKKIDMGVNRDINIDWVNDAKIIQDFEQVKDKTWMLSKDEVSINFGITERSKGIFGQKAVTYKKYEINEPINDSIFKGPDIVVRPDPASGNPDYWEKNRHNPLSKTENGVYGMVDSLKKIPSFRIWMDVIMLITTDFYTRKKFEFGPVGSFYSYNPVEGSRVRFGGRTTPDFSKKITLDGYLAYGFNDQQFKYSAGVTYSLTPRTIYQFPVKSLKLNYQYDTQIPGQELLYNQGDNFFLSFKRGVNDKFFYNRSVKFEYLNEFQNHFSYLLGYKYLIQTPGGNLFFNTVDYQTFTNNVGNITIPEIYLTLRYAPNETFYQGKLYRDRLPGRYPVLTLNYNLGSGSLGNDYNYSRIQFSIYKRFYPSILGYTDITAEAGRVFGKVPYPLLFIHRANQTYTYQKESYNLMNFLEFVSDRYVSLNFDHCFNGFFFNKIPLFKRLKFREIISFKALYGGLSDKNDPALQNNLFKFPTDNIGTPLTFSLETKPYIEAGVGISNIFKIFRIDYVRRVTYKSNPYISKSGIRVQFRFDI